MSVLFPPIEPYDHGTLEGGGRHRVYWECCGNPGGRPALFLHGGPGSGCLPNQRRFFDPSRYNAVLLDQRGCGRSRPLASDPDVDLSSNTTAHLIADLEALRELRRVDRWTILGLSWGCTLALAYAQTYPNRINALVLASVTTTSRREVQWITEDMGRVFPQQWERFINAIPESLRHLGPVEAYARMLADPDPPARDRAAQEWCAWEDAHVLLSPGHTPNPRYRDPAFCLQFARLVTHYWRHAAFLEDDQLIRDAAKLNGIPGALIHGRLDVSSPLITAWRLSRRWTTCRLRVLDDAGHGGGNSFVPAVIDALNKFASV